MLNNTPRKTQPITILSVQGRAEWEGRGEYLNLNFWVRTAEGIILQSFSLPHDCENIGYKDLVTEDHIAGFIHRLNGYYPLDLSRGYIKIFPENCIPWVEDQMEGESIYYPSDLSRGYIRIFPKNCLPYFDDENQELNAFFSQTSFRDLLDQKFKTPIALKPIVETLKPRIKEWLATPLLQIYLRGKAFDMGNFWASKVDCGEPDDLVWAIANDAMDHFNRGRVPFYETNDYGIGHALKSVQYENNLGKLISALPLQTWKHFDFADAPTFSI